MTIKEVTNYLESIAPLSYQESYDNSGLIVGEPSNKVNKVLLCLDSIESVVDEAITKRCQLIIAHHPIVFSGLKSFTGKNYIEKTIIKAIQNNIAIYACHTNLDNVLNFGVNEKIAKKLNVKNYTILAPKKNQLQKIISFVPKSHQQIVLDSIFSAGAGQIGKYSNCSFSSEGKGSFKASNAANPHIGEKGKIHFENEYRVEAIFPKYLQRKVIDALLNSHPYEEVAYDIFNLENKFNKIGSGLIGEIEEETPVIDFLNQIKVQLQTNTIKYTNPHKSTIKKIAICGGSGSFLLPYAINNKADIFITADYKYHQFFDAENKIIIADIGHYESEHYTIELFHDILAKQFKSINFVKTEINTNPVNYL